MDIVCTIIEQTDDLSTLHNWCLACSKSMLCKTAYASRFRHLSLDYLNLPSPPDSAFSAEGESPKRSKKATKILKLEGVYNLPGLGQLLIECSPDNGLLPAAFLRHLDLNLKNMKTLKLTLTR